MRTLHLYLTRQVLAALAMTVTVFTFVLLLGNIIKEILRLLLSGHATFLLILQAIGLLIPFVLVFALPMGMLTAALLVFGRFSADQELTAARASGISLVSLITPILMVSVVLSAVCAWVNCELAPTCRAAYNDLRFTILSRNPAGILQENQFVQLPGGYSIYVRKIDGQNLGGVEIFRTEEEDNSTRWLKADKGKFHYDAATKEVTFTLFDAYGARKKPEGLAQPLPDQGLVEIKLDLSGRSERKQELKPADMTLAQLVVDLQDRRAKGLPESPARVQMHRMISFSFACVGFTLIGIPLGVRAHRRETSIGIAIALVLVLIYYSFFIVGQSLATRPEWKPHLILWAPNLLFYGVGAWLLCRANRGETV